MIQGVTFQVPGIPGEPVEGANLLRPEATQEAPSFQDLLGKLLHTADGAQKSADLSLRELAAGESGASLQNVIMNLEEADLTFRLMKEIRDKLLVAYRDIVNMQA
jgi:flagellar hook-basal body complex protein FliE